MMSSPIVHVDIAGPEEAAQQRFYAELFDWWVESKRPGYALIITPGESPNGALVEADVPSVTIGVSVPDLDVALERTVELGGMVTIPATDNGLVVKAQVADPSGNAITLQQQ